MYDLTQALKKVQEYLANSYDVTRDGEIVVNEPFISERAKGWVFPYNTKLFLQTKRPPDGLVGNGPIFVDRTSERLYRLPSGGWKRMLDEYDATGMMPSVTQEMRHIGQGEQPSFLDGVAQTLEKLKT